MDSIMDIAKSYNLKVLEDCAVGLGTKWSGSNVGLFGDAASWQQLVERGMRQDWSWNRSAQHYVDFYHQTISRVRDAVLS